MQRRRKKMDDELIYSAQLRQTKLNSTEREHLEHLLKALQEENPNMIWKAKMNFLGLQGVAQITALSPLMLQVCTNIKEGGRRRLLILGIGTLASISVLCSMMWDALAFILLSCLIILCGLTVMAIGVYIEERIKIAFKNLSTS